MQIWVDADACPSDAKDLLYKVVQRLGVRMTLVANASMSYPRSELIRFELVKAGANVADQRIVESLSAGDLVITGDIPLAANAIEKGAVVIDPRGDLLDEANIGTRLTTRNLMEGFRAAGVRTSGPAAYSAKDKQNFANQLDRILTRLMKPAP